MSVTETSLTNIFTSPETEFTSALVSHLYGVFPTHGFPNDTFFPSTYSIGEVVLENSGCAVNNKVRSSLPSVILEQLQLGVDTG